MTDRYDGSKGAATHLLQYYFRLVAQRTGVQWDSDNDIEIEAIVDGIITASVREVTRTVLKSVMCPACGVRLAGASGLCRECEREATRLSYAAQAGTQPQRVAWVHVPPVADSLSECPSCLTEIGVLFWQDGKSLVQECPACGVFLDVYKNDDGLQVHAVGLERPSEAEED